MWPLRVGFAAVLSMLLLGACGGGAKPIQGGSTTSPVSTTTTTAAAPPTSAQIATEIAATHEVSDPSEGFADSPPVTVSDGHGGYVTAVSAGKTPTADGHGGLVFFWHDQTFQGWDTDQETWNVLSLTAKGTNAINATYPDYAPKDPACCPSLSPVTITYSWNGTGIAQSRAFPPGTLVGTAVERDCLAANFTASPGGGAAALGNDVLAANLKNVSSRPCFASGYPTIYGVSVAGALQMLPAVHGTYFGDVTPGSVSPGGTALLLLATSVGCAANQQPQTRHAAYTKIEIALANGSGDVRLSQITLNTTCSLAVSQIGTQRTS